MRYKLLQSIKPKYILILILLLGGFFRLYNAEHFFRFEHDQDLYSWIAKDILSGDIRLLGQLTTVDGLFIGPIFYYVVAFFYLIFNYNPFSMVIPITFISLLTTVSIYYIFTDLFNRKAALIGSFVYSVSFTIVLIERSPVPTQPIILWSVWYLYLLMCILKGNTKLFFLAGILLGLIWHIHIALVPLTALIPLSIYLSKVKISRKQVIYSGLGFIILMTPFFLFEIRHQFSQSLAMFNSVTEGRMVERLPRFISALDGLTIGLTRTIPHKISLDFRILFILFVIISGYLFKKASLLSQNQKIIIFVWPFLLFLGQFLASNDISDHYFNSATIIGILILALFLAEFKAFGRILSTCVLAIILLGNIYFLFTSKKLDNGYFYKKELVEFIKKDYELNQYPCVGISYIGDFGTGVGFRYLLWYKKINTIAPNINIPIYDIIVQEDKVDRIDYRFGSFGLNKPKPGIYDYSLCTNKNYKEELPLGFVD